MGLANEIISATVAAGSDIRWAGATERTAKPKIGSGTNRATDFKFEDAGRCGVGTAFPVTSGSDLIPYVSGVVADRKPTITAPSEETASLICKWLVSESGFEDTGPS
jgi:hypothetical protein